MTYDFQALQRIFAQIAPSAAKDITTKIHSHQRIFVHGAGRSGLMLKAFAMRLAQAGHTVYVVGEVVTPAIGQGDLLILASASGKTASILHSAQTARTVGAFVFTITTTPDAPLCALSDACIFINAPSKDQGNGSSIMGTLFEQALLLFCDCAVEALGADATRMRVRHANLE